MELFLDGQKHLLVRINDLPTPCPIYKYVDDSTIFEIRNQSRVSVVGETGASCYNFQLKTLFVISMLDALFLSAYTLSLSFVLINCTIPLIFHIVVR